MDKTHDKQIVALVEAGNKYVEPRLSKDTLACHPDTLNFYECAANSREAIRAMHTELLALREVAAEMAEDLKHIANGCLVPPDGGSPTFDDLVITAQQALAKYNAMKEG